MRLPNPMASLSTTPRRLLAALLVLAVTGVVADRTITSASGKLSATAANSSNTFTAGSCFVPTAVSVGSSGNAFSPASVTISAGCSITWTRFGGNHTTTNTSPTEGSLWDAPMDGSNPPFTRQFPTAGTFPYWCHIHRNTMTGTIIVN